jgi:hypothetical protein
MMDTTHDSTGSSLRDCPSDLVLDRYLLGEFGGPEEARLAAHIDGCDRCGAFVRGAAAFDGDGAEERILSTIERESQREERAGPTKSRGPAIFIGALAVAVVAVGALSPLWRTPREESRPAGEKAPPTVRVKGAPATLLLYRLAQGEPLLLSPEEAVQPGDVLQASVQTTTMAHAALYDQMETAVKLLAPADGRIAVALLPGREGPLEPAFKVDSLDPGEKLVLISCPRPFTPQAAPTAPDRFAAWLPLRECVRLERPLRPAAEPAP